MAIPAIDLIGGKIVRLSRGDYSQASHYDLSPADFAHQLEKAGFRRLHVVDLDGAKGNTIVNADTLRQICASTSLMVDFGGGIKSEEQARRALSLGATYVTLGSIAALNPEETHKIVSHIGAGKFILGADVLDGHIRTNGWRNDSRLGLFQFLDQYVGLGVSRVICTDISRDGMLQGPSVELYSQIMARYPSLQLIASGGVGSMTDIESLDRAHIPAAIVGKAIYEGRIDISQLAQRYGGGRVGQAPQPQQPNKP